MTFICIRCRQECDTDDGYRPAPQFGSLQPPGSLHCLECINDMESWETDAAILRKQSAANERR